MLSPAVDTDGLLQALCEELHLLAAADPAALETTLLIHPQAMTDFLDYNEFLEAADAAVESLGYAGVLQVASFHPRYQFDGTAIDDVTNATNRSPYPTLHLLRESSIDRAVQAFGDTDRIYRNNIRTLQALGEPVGPNSRPARRQPRACKRLTIFHRAMVFSAGCGAPPMYPFTYHRARNLTDALAAAADPEARLLAGGMTLIPSMKHP